MAGYRPGKFDPSREFVTTVAFRCNGRTVGKGYRFNKSEVSVRTLGLLYEHRKIIYDDHPLAIRLFTKAAARSGKAKGVAPAPMAQTPAGDPVGAPSPATIAPTEDELIEKLMARFNKADLFALVKDIPGVKMAMSKAELARVAVRSGHGNS